MNYNKSADCYAKLVCNKAEDERVVGIHFLGPNAGEVIQGFAVAIRKGATKSDFDHTVGIHPTMAEEFTTMKAIAGSADEEKTGCWGWSWVHCPWVAWFLVVGMREYS